MCPGAGDLCPQVLPSLSIKGGRNTDLQGLREGGWGPSPHGERAGKGKRECPRAEAPLGWFGGPPQLVRVLLGLIQGAEPV